MLSDYLTLFAGYVRFLRTLSGLHAEECVWPNTLPIVFTMGSSGVRISVERLSRTCRSRYFSVDSETERERTPVSLLSFSMMKFDSPLRFITMTKWAVDCALGYQISLRFTTPRRFITFSFCASRNRIGKTEDIIGREVVNSFREIPR